MFLNANICYWQLNKEYCPYCMRYRAVLSWLQRPLDGLVTLTGLNPIPIGGGPIRPPPMVFPLLLPNRWAKDDGIWVTFPKIYLRNLWNLIFWNPFIIFLSIVSFRKTTFLQNWLNKCFRFLYNNRSNPKSIQYFFKWFELEVIR